MSELLVLGNGLLGSTFEHYCPVIDHETCDITSRFDLDAIIAKYKPKVVINAAGITRPDDIMTLFKVNSQAPRMIASVCDEHDIRLVQISTDCVYSGKKGKYLEIETPDPDTMYGMSKYLGEITEYPHLTVRVSFVGYPDPKGRGLLAWASKEKVVTGYDKVLWNGLTTVEFARMLVETIIPMRLSDVIHVYGETISKYDLLKTAKHVFDFDYQLIKESEVTETPHVSDKTLTSILPEFHVTKSFRQQMEEMKEWTTPEKI